MPEPITGAPGGAPPVSSRQSITEDGARDPGFAGDQLSEAGEAPEISLTPEQISALGLDGKAAGDSAYLTVKLTLTGGESGISGASIAEAGGVSDTPPEGVELTPLGTAEDDAVTEDLETEDEEGQADPEAPGSDIGGEGSPSPIPGEGSTDDASEADIAAEEKAIGYKRSRSKARKISPSFLKTDLSLK